MNRSSKEQRSEEEAVAAEASFATNDKNGRKVWAHASRAPCWRRHDDDAAARGGVDLLCRRRGGNRLLLRGGHHLSRARTLPLRHRGTCCHHRLRVGVSRSEDIETTTRTFSILLSCASINQTCLDMSMQFSFCSFDTWGQSCHQGWNWPYGHYFCSFCIAYRVSHDFIFLWGRLHSLF